MKYVIDLKGRKTLTREEEKKYAIDIENSKKENATRKEIIAGEQAKDILINFNFGLIFHVMKNFKTNLDNEELMQFGLCGLIDAVKNYDYRLAKFSTCAEQWIYQAIDRGIKNNEKTIKIPQRKIDLIKKINYEINEFRLKNGREPKENELIDSLTKREIKINHNDLVELLIASQANKIKSSDKEILEGLKQIDLIPDDHTQTPDEYLTKKYNLNKFYEILKGVPLIDQHIFILSFGLFDNIERNVSQICKELCISSDKVNRSLLKTKEYLRNNNIDL